MKNSKEWWSVSELLDKELETLPKTDKGISKKADRENWKKRQRSGVKGKTFEYHYSSFPEDVQRALGLYETSGSKSIAGGAIPFILGAAAAIPVNLQQTTQQNTLSSVPSVENEERVPVYDAKASAGFGALNSDIYAPSDYIGLSKQWIESRGLYRDSLAFIMAVGDSMYPTINNGDMLLINRNAKTLRDGKIYVIRSGDQLWVKRVQGIINGIRLISDNKAIYDPVDVHFNESVDFEVLGQVVFIGRDTI